MSRRWVLILAGAATFGCVAGRGTATLPQRPFLWPYAALAATEGGTPARDIRVVDQDGHELAFSRDLLLDKTVAITVMYSSCKKVCPLQAARLTKLQALMGERLGTELSIVSISLQPDVDTPQRLREWGQKVGVRRGWSLITGSEASLKQLLTQLIGQTNLVSDDHGAFVLLADERSNTWKPLFELVKPTEIFQLMEEMRRGLHAPPEELRAEN